MLIDGLRTFQPDLVAFAESIKTDEYDQVADLLGPALSVMPADLISQNDILDECPHVVVMMDSKYFIGGYYTLPE